MFKLETDELLRTLFLTYVIVEHYKELHKGTFINDFPRFFGHFWPNYLFLLYNAQFWGLYCTPLPTLISDVINGRSIS